MFSLLSYLINLLAAVAVTPSEMIRSTVAVTLLNEAGGRGGVKSCLWLNIVF